MVGGGGGGLLPPCRRVTHNQNPTADLSWFNNRHRAGQRSSLNPDARSSADVEVR